jgi:hypothetical protein
MGSAQSESAPRHFQQFLVRILSLSRALQKKSLACPPIRTRVPVVCSKMLLNVFGAKTLRAKGHARQQLAKAESQCDEPQILGPSVLEKRLKKQGHIL